jgi:hypothetical protein
MDQRFQKAVGEKSMISIANNWIRIKRRIYLLVSNTALAISLF